MPLALTMGGKGLFGEGLEQAWAPGQKLYQLEELSNISTTELAGVCDEYSLTDYLKTGSSSEYLEIFEWNEESIAPDEKLRRGFAMAAAEQPVHLLCSEFDDRSGIDPIVAGDFVLRD